MRIHDKRAKIIARSYAIARSREFPHFDKNPEYIEKWFRKILENGLEPHKSICKDNYTSFSEKLALLAFFRPQNADVVIDDGLFTHMCYILVLYATYSNGFTIDYSIRDSIVRYAQLLKISDQEAQRFFKKICDDLWIIASAKVAD